MRILQIVNKPQRRGAEIFALQLSRELRRQNHAVKIVYLYPYQGDSALALAQEDIVLAGDEAHWLEKVAGAHPGLLRRLRQTIGAFAPDIVQVNGARTVKYGALAHLGRGQQGWALIYRNIGNPQDWQRGLHYHLFYTHLVMPQLDGVVGVTQTTLDNLKKSYRLTIPTINIPRGVDPTQLVPTVPAPEMRAKMQTPGDAHVLLFVGSLSPEKRLDRLLNVVAQVHAQGEQAYLWIVGDGALRRELEALVKGLGLEPWVRFAGIQPDVANYMAAADLLLLTSDTEGLPGVILEAGMVGIPAVATRVGGVHESMLDGETGLLIEPHDESGFASAVVELLRDRARRLEMGQKAERWVQANFTMAKIAQRYLEFYRGVLEARRSLAR